MDYLECLEQVTNCDDCEEAENIASEYGLGMLKVTSGCICCGSTLSLLQFLFSFVFVYVIVCKITWLSIRMFSRAFLLAKALD